MKDAAGMAQVWVGLGQWNHVLNNYDDPKDSKNIDRGSSSYTKSHKNKSTASSKAMDAAYNSQLQALARALNTLQKVLKQLSKQLKK